uniref:hypothetical protein n=1 Tax=Streptomyces sp. CA-141956 TaxID=3240051 RepID=UPI003F4973CB
MTENLYINGRLYWETRTPTKHGYFGPLAVPTASRFYDEASTAQRRKQRRAFERSMDQQIVELATDVIVIYSRKAYRIVETRGLPEDLWDTAYEQAFAKACEHWDKYPHNQRPTKATWSDRPVMVVVRLADKPKAKPIHLRAPASYRWAVLPEHYAVCASCGELPPCQHEIDENNVTAAMNRAEDLMAIQPGCCLGCTEPITHRMKSVRFPGPNLWRPDLGDNTAVFHARAECAGDAQSYRRQWEKQQNKPSMPEQTALPLSDAGDNT